MIFLCCIVPIYIHIFLLISKSVQVIAAGDLCAICQEKMHAPILLRCKHIFCEDCVSEWWVSKSMQVFSFPQLSALYFSCLFSPNISFRVQFILYCLVTIVLENLPMLVFIRFERERTCPLCRALVKPADLRSFGDGSTSLFFQLFWVSWWWKIASEHDNIIVSNSHISLMGKFIVFYFLLSQLFLFIGSLPQGGCASRGGWLTCSYDRVIKVLGIYLLWALWRDFSKGNCRQMGDFSD